MVRIRQRPAANLAGLLGDKLEIRPIANLLQVRLDHRVFDDLPASCGPVLQAGLASYHFVDPAFEPVARASIGEGSADIRFSEHGKHELKGLAEAVDAYVASPAQRP